jgi:hypothetical protein
MSDTVYLRATAQILPRGATLYRFEADGIVSVVSCGGVRRLDPTRRDADRAELLPFIDAGQFTSYLVGSSTTSDANPANATFKIGFVRPQSAFTPHAHGAEHFVLNMGYASCGLFDAERDAVAHVRLVPGALLHIPALMPHSFNNRAGVPLPLVITNTGMGIDHEEYAITAAQAEERARKGEGEQHARMAAALRRLATEMPSVRAHAGLSLREQLAARLRRLAGALEGGDV